VHVAGMMLARSALSFSPRNERERIRFTLASKRHGAISKARRNALIASSSESQVVEGMEPTGGHSNYLLGGWPAGWITGRTAL
jgi:hypothetical protein